MARIVLSDQMIQEKTDAFRSLLIPGGPTYLRLFQNNFTPDASSLLSDFVEATFNTYHAIDISTTLGSKSQVQAGEWHFFTGVYTFAAPTTGSPQTIYGCYIEVHFPTVFLVASSRFDSPIVMSVGGLPFSLQLEFIDWAAYILGAP